MVSPASHDVDFSTNYHRRSTRVIVVTHADDSRESKAFSRSSVWASVTLSVRSTTQQEGTCVSFCNQPKAHFGLPCWVRPCDNRGKCHVDEKRIQCLSNASQHVPICLQPFPNNSSPKFKSSPFLADAYVKMNDLIKVFKLGTWNEFGITYTSNVVFRSKVQRSRLQGHKMESILKVDVSFHLISTAHHLVFFYELV